MDRFLTDTVSTVMLPLFLIMILCAIAGCKPEPVVKGILDLMVAVVVGIVRLACTLAGLAFTAGRKSRRLPPSGPNRDSSRRLSEPRSR